MSSATFIWTLTSIAATVDEGGTVTFTVKATNVPAGEYSYIIGGTVASADIVGGVNGSVKIDSLDIG